MAENDASKTSQQRNNPFDSVLNASYEVWVTKLKNGFVDLTYDDFQKEFEKTSGKILSTVKIEVNDSLDMYYRTAKVWIADRTSLRELMPLTGNDIITVKYKNLIAPEVDNKSGTTKVFHFSIVNIEEQMNIREMSNRGSNDIVLNLVEAPAFQLFTNNKIYMTYPLDAGSETKYPLRQNNISSIMMDAFTAAKAHLWYDIEIEETHKNEEDKINFFIPNWTLQKTISYLRKFSVSNKDLPYYICHIDPPRESGHKPKIILKSVYSYMRDKITQVFTQTFSHQLYKPSADGSEVRDLNAEETESNHYNMLNTIRSYKFNSFNRIRSIGAGQSGETFATFDYVIDNNYTTLDYKSFLEGYSGLGNKSLQPVHGYGNQWSDFNPSSFNEPKRLLNMKLNEFSENTIKSGLMCEAICTLNHFRRVGQTSLLTFKNTFTGLEVDSMMSGTWLLWGQTDIITDSEAFSIVSFAKDAYEFVLNNTSSDRLTDVVHVNPLPKGAAGEGVVKPDSTKTGKAQQEINKAVEKFKKKTNNIKGT